MSNQLDREQNSIGHLRLQTKICYTHSAMMVCSFQKPETMSHRFCVHYNQTVQCSSEEPRLSLYFWLYYLLAFVVCLSTLCINFLHCKMGITLVPTS